jgi:NTP pyrophosphatase (non-canonical NTP hydrolase)
MGSTTIKRSRSRGVEFNEAIARINAEREKKRTPAKKKSRGQRELEAARERAAERAALRDEAVQERAKRRLVDEINARADRPWLDDLGPVERFVKVRTADRNVTRSRVAFLEQVLAERNRQIDRWGTGNPGFADMLAVLQEEVGEVARAYNDGDVVNALDELMQVGAVACRIFEQIARGDQWPDKLRAHTKRGELKADLAQVSEQLHTAAQCFLGNRKPPPDPADFALAATNLRRIMEAL